MASTDLNLEECGSLPKPGPIGRVVRLIFGGLCLYYVAALWSVIGSPITQSGSIVSVIWNGVIPSLILISYVINIGFSRAWKKWPAIGSALLLLVVAALGHWQYGTLENATLAKAILGWELYLFLHLGSAFFLAAFLRTPGCEMRAFHHLYSAVTGRPTKEHHCPIGPLSAIDKWEASQRTP